MDMRNVVVSNDEPEPGDTNTVDTTPHPGGQPGGVQGGQPGGVPGGDPVNGRPGGRIGGVPGGVPGGTGTQPAPVVDYSERARIDCNADELAEFYPDEANEAGGIEAIVRYRIEVNAQGRIVSVRANNDPGYGFAAAGRRLLMSGRCSVSAARDRAGQPAPFTFNAFSVTFQPPT
jgi:outer membrane biosynthesis protein TonB